MALVAAGSALGTPLVVFGVALPLLLLHDVGRYIAIARQRPMGAVVIDTQWLVVMAGGLVALLVFDKSSLAWLVAAWAGSGAVAGLWVFAQCGLPGPGGFGWLRDRWQFSWRSLVSGLAASGTLLVAAALMTVLSDATSVAAFRAATLLGAPSTAIQTAVSTSAAADIARERDDAAAVWGHIRRAMSISGVIGVLNLVVLVFLPDVLGRALLGAAWEIVKPLMLAVSLKVLLMAAQSGVRASLVGRRRIQVAMVTDMLSILLACVCMVIGADRGGAEGALWGMAVGTGVSTACWWVALWWADRHPERSAVVAAQPALQRSA
jgi:O-antigen/teichoic acid export membrane protein